MIRPDPALAFEVAAEECRLAEERGEAVIDFCIEAHTVDVTVGSAWCSCGAGISKMGKCLQVHIPTDTEHDWGITICAWQEEI